MAAKGTNMSDNRMDRSLETRTEDMRDQLWEPSRILPDPPPEEGMEFRWVRSKIKGQVDTVNVSRAMREGYSLVRADESLLSQMKIIRDYKSEFNDGVEVGGMLLMKRPVRIGDQIRAASAKRTIDQITAVDNDLLKMEDKRMPIIIEKTTKIKNNG